MNLDLGLGLGLGHRQFSSPLGSPRDYGLLSHGLPTGHQPPPLQFNFQSITQALGSHLNFDSQPSTVRVVISFQILIPPLGIQLSALRPLVHQPAPNRLESLRNQQIKSNLSNTKVLDRLQSSLASKKP